MSRTRPVVEIRHAGAIGLMDADAGPCCMPSIQRRRTAIGSRHERGTFFHGGSVIRFDPLFYRRNFLKAALPGRPLTMNMVPRTLIVSAVVIAGSAAGSAPVHGRIV